MTCSVYMDSISFDSSISLFDILSDPRNSPAVFLLSHHRYQFIYTRRRRGCCFHEIVLSVNLSIWVIILIIIFDDHAIVIDSFSVTY